MTAAQRRAAVDVMQGSLDSSDDWTVQNTTMQVLAERAGSDDVLWKWLIPRLVHFTNSSRTSVANRARELVDSPRPQPDGGQTG